MLVLPCAPTSGPYEVGKKQYLTERMSKIETIKTIKLADIEYDAGHPTERGTKEIVTQINTVLEKNMILEGAEDDTTTSKRYSQVQAIYKVGCRGCDTDNFTPQLCPECKEKAKEVDDAPLRKIIEEIEQQCYPQLNGSDGNEAGMSDDGTLVDGDSEMGEPKKRGHDEINENESKSKNPRQTVE